MTEKKPLRILIVDDEAPARQRLLDVLDDCRDKIELTVADEAENGIEALEAVERNPVDVALLDIRMPGMDGLELAKHLLARENPPAVIFTTAYDQYALSAFEVNAIDYLVKPIRADRLLAALEKARQRRLSRELLAKIAPEPRAHLSIHERGRIILVPIDEVLYFKAEQKYITVRTRHREHLLEGSLVNLEEEFGERFTRIHRNCLVATKEIAGFEKVSKPGESNWAVVLRDWQEKLPVSRRQQHVVRSF